MIRLKAMLLFFLILPSPAWAQLDQKLISAVGRGDANTLEQYLASGGDVNARTTGRRGKGFTLLHWAANAGSAKLVKQLLAAGAKVDAVGAYRNSTPLVRASLFGNIDVADLLIRAGADVNHMTKNGETALSGVVSRGRVEMVEFLLKNGADVNLTRSVAGPPIMMVVHIGEVDSEFDGSKIVRQWKNFAAAKPILHLLIQAGANPSAKGMKSALEKNAEKNSLLDDWVAQACLMNRPDAPDIIQFLLSKNAAFNRPSKKALLFGQRQNAGCRKVLRSFQTAIPDFQLNPNELMWENIYASFAVCLKYYNTRHVPHHEEGSVNTKISYQAALYKASIGELEAKYGKYEPKPSDVDRALSNMQEFMSTDRTARVNSMAERLCDHYKRDAEKLLGPAKSRQLKQAVLDAVR